MARVRLPPGPAVSLPAPPAASAIPAGAARGAARAKSVKTVVEIRMERVPELWFRRGFIMTQARLSNPLT
ncbi:hypothetical protein GCM10008941_15490 [Rhizomicrobium palustre]